MSIPSRTLFALLVTACSCLPQPGVAQSAFGTGNGNGNLGSGNGTGNGNGNNNTGTATSSLTVTSHRNTPAIVAPGLAAAGVESCLGSTSVGGAASGFGVTIAGTMTDKGCNLRLFARTLYATGHVTAATQILCNDPQAAEALAVEGVKCLVGPLADPTPPPPTQSKGLFGCDDFSILEGCKDRPVVHAETSAVVHSVEDDRQQGAVNLKRANVSSRTKVHTRHRSVAERQIQPITTPASDHVVSSASGEMPSPR